MTMLRVIVAWLLLCLAASAQVGQIPAWPPTKFVASGGGYQGPGDVVTGATPSGFWSPARRYSSTSSGSIADVVDSATGNTTGTRLQCASGVVSALVSASACTFVTGNACSSLATTCATACKVVTLYEQSGGGGGNMTQATNADRPTLTLSALGGKNCMAFTSVQQLNGSTSISQAQPVTAIAVAERTGAFTTTATIFDTHSSNTGLVFANTANTIDSFAGTATISAAATDSAFHVAIATFNGASSSLVVDGGTATTGNPGTSGFTGIYEIGPGGFGGITGNICELAAYFTALTPTQISAFNSNAHGSNGYSF